MLYTGHMISRHIKSHSTGFTIVELLIVVVVIAILAAITIVSYNGINQRAADAALKADVNQAVTQIGSYDVDNSGYPSNLAALNSGNGLQYNTDFTFEYTNSGSSFCVTGSSTLAGKSYRYDSTEGVIVEGVCTGHLGLIELGPWDSMGVGEFSHTCAVYEGAAYCWGYGSGGALGNGNTTNQDAPVAVNTAGVLAGKTITKVATSSGNSCALAEGDIFCWGNGAGGGLGNGTTTTSTVPVAVTMSGALAGKEVIDITVGNNGGCAIADDNRAYCWGENSTGKLGNNTTTDSSVPVAVDTSGVLSGPVSAISMKSNTCALSNGAVYCWGYNANGQLGNGNTTNSPVPFAVNTAGVLSGRTIEKVAVGAYHVLVLADDGRVYVWGHAPYGLGSGVTSSTTPTAVTVAGVLAGKNVTSIAAGGYNSCVIADDNAIYCWGQGTSGQLGNNNNVSSGSPVAVDMTGALSGKLIQTVSVGTYHTCALASGDPFCWGRNNWRQLGNSGTADVWFPGVVTAP